MIDWDVVERALYDAKGIAWDTCHKIYVLMDDEQVALMREYEYEQVITAAEVSDAELLAIVQKWYKESCDLRFVQSVATNHHDTNAGFESLIDQFADVEDED